MEMKLRRMSLEIDTLRAENKGQEVNEESSEDASDDSHIASSPPMIQCQASAGCDVVRTHSKKAFPERVDSVKKWIKVLLRDKGMISA